uniref:Ovule protein n=1 Tax=Rhabditophanes sp. KR3021 TaxID=114890 RepID=A0AC35TVF1_9BILA
MDSHDIPQGFDPVSSRLRNHRNSNEPYNPRFRDEFMDSNAPPVGSNSYCGSKNNSTHKCKIIHSRFVNDFGDLFAFSNCFKAVHSNALIPQLNSNSSRKMTSGNKRGVFQTTASHTCR